MDYHLLGPVEVRDQGTAVVIGGPRQRTVLAVLALNLGQVVPVRRLVDSVWDDAPPVTAHGQILTAVSALRRALGSAIETRPAGYLLHASPRDVDVHVFERLAAEACQFHASGQLDCCVARLREGLALWRGQALGGVRGLAAEVAKLEERRLLVHERCLEAELALGRHADRVGELLALVDAYPLRERFRALLMRALHQLGRRAEALDAYRSGRRLLVEELGIEPGPELQRLHQTILTGGDEPGPAAAVAPVAPIGQVQAFSLAETGNGGPPTLKPAMRVPAAHVAEQHVPGPEWYHDPPRPVEPAFFGVTLNSTSGRMPDFRVGAVRLWDCSCRWSNVQPRKDVFDWQTLDRLVAGARDADLPVLYTMGTPPGWACPDAKRAPYLDDCRAAPPDDLADWDAYVRATVTRYRGRIEAYELWDYINSPMRFTGDADVVAEMVGRAASIIKEVDPSALVVSPSFGDLWDPAAREKLKTYAEAGALEPCDAVAVKLHPRDYSAAPPEEMIELARLVDQTLHRVGAQRLFWGAGPSHDVGNAPRLDHAKAGAYAVRQFLVGIFAECARMYFYYWGGRNVPIVLQAEGGPPTQAAWFVDRLQRWLSGAYVRSASHGSDDNLPPNVWQLRFVFPSRPGGPPDQSSAEAVIRWTDGGTATMPLEPGTDRIEHLDGTVETPHAGATVHVTELPILIRYHPVPFRLVTRDQSLLVE